jgi:hypothetical protein
MQVHTRKPNNLVATGLHTREKTGCESAGAAPSTLANAPAESALLLSCSSCANSLSRSCSKRRMAEAGGAPALPAACGDRSSIALRNSAIVREAAPSFLLKPNACSSSLSLHSDSTHHALQKARAKIGHCTASLATVGSPDNQPPRKVSVKTPCRCHVDATRAMLSATQVSHLQWRWRRRRQQRRRHQLGWLAVATVQGPAPSANAQAEAY